MALTIYSLRKFQGSGRGCGSPDGTWSVASSRVFMSDLCCRARSHLQRQSASSGSDYILIAHAERLRCGSKPLISDSALLPIVSQRASSLARPCSVNVRVALQGPSHNLYLSFVRVCRFQDLLQMVLSSSVLAKWKAREPRVISSIVFISMLMGSKHERGFSGHAICPISDVRRSNHFTFLIQLMSSQELFGDIEVRRS